jgi:cell division protein ZapE
MSQPKPTPLALYENRLARSELRDDPSQRHALMALQQLYDQLAGTCATPKRGWLARLLRQPAKKAHGLYLYGDVGRGKSMLVDLFAECATQVCSTRRVHFHAFMLDVHKRLHAYRQSDHDGDLMPKVVAAIADECRVLCLDEMQVSDVTDAMILARLFSGLMDAGMVLLFTSNRPPRQLYQGGLQRDQFLKFVDLIEARLRIVELQSPTDYRLEQWRTLRHTYQHPRDGVADDFLVDSWKKLTGDASSEPLRLEVQGRILRIDKQAHGVAWLTFGELCVRPLGANDYLTLAKVCHTLLLQGIPALTREERNEAKRFVTLIDALYEHRVKLIATAATSVDNIYPAGDGSFEFARTASRLHEMQSEQYLALAHISA